jgi:hypothetical protein
MATIALRAQGAPQFIAARASRRDPETLRVAARNASRLRDRPPYSVCLGGSDDPSNLWAEPRRGIEPKWNAEAKDRLEHIVCEMVCDQQLDLAKMQKALAGDWIAAYHKIYEPH